jgi:tetratricopeptide (TPR) repeat protein
MAPEILQTLANAQLLINEKEYQLAKNLYRSILRLDPTHELAIRGIAECASRLHQHPEAIQILKQLIERHETAGNLKSLADQYYTLEYLEDARHFYQRAITAGLLDPIELFDVYKNLGNVQLKLGDIISAEENYNKAYTIQPDSDALLVNFGSLSIYRGEYDKALARFREAVRLNDRNDKAWVGLAMIHREYGDCELAWANVEKALDIMPSQESAIKLVCDWAMKDNEIEKAILRLEAYLKVNDQDAMMSMWFAKFLYFTGRLDQAQVEIEKALYLDPHLVDGLEVAEVIRAEIDERETRHARASKN